MVFVTVGNATQGFKRLLTAVDKIAGDLLKAESVWVQSGNNPDFQPLYCEYVPFLSEEKFVEKVREADVIVSHGGAGSLIHFFRAGKVPVVMPRQKAYGEHIDDHQLDLVRMLAAENRVIPAYEAEDLLEAIGKATCARKVKDWDQPNRMLLLISQALEEIAGPRYSGRN